MEQSPLNEAAQALYDAIGLVSPNSKPLLSKAARLLMTPRFYGSEITVRMLIIAYVYLCYEKVGELNP